MRVRRCAILLIEPRERLEFEFATILEGGDGSRAERAWIALAPHLDSEAVLLPDDLAPLGTIPVRSWVEYGAAAAEHDPAVLQRLMEQGLLIADTPEFAAMRARDDALRASHWHALAAVLQAFGRWQGVAAGEQVRSIGIESVADLVDRLGPPPPHFHACVPAAERIALEPAETTLLDVLLRGRATCRNYDTSRPVPRSVFSQLLRRTFGAQATVDVTGEAAIVKKTSPSAGGLHPTEAYLLVQNVAGVAPGLYHYHAGEYALEPLRELAADEARALASRFVAAQDWFAEAHVLVVFAPRFRRSFWKYREHAKVYRAVTLDVGHLSQTLQISATEFGLGAFVTAAINEIDIEQALGLDAMQEGALAVGGFGWRAHACTRMELDPLRVVWPAA